MKKHYFSIILTTILLLLEISSYAQITTSLGEVRDKSELLIGFNRRSNKGSWWSNTSFKSLVAKMNPEIVRYPGGTQANYWDWHNGKFIDNTDKPWYTREVLTIPTFASVITSKTKVIYVVNMSRPTSATGIDVNSEERILKSDATLDKVIVDIKDAIAEFVSNGITPYAIELGNEYYFGNEEAGIFHIVENAGKYYSGWDKVNETAYSHTNKKDATITNVKFYLNHCEKIVSDIIKDYPDMKFALISTKRGRGTSTRESWNETIYSELEKSDTYPTLFNKVTALTQHHYIDDKYGDQTIVVDKPTAKIAIAEGITYPRSREADYQQVPSKYKIWYTEYGATKKTAETMWTTGMRSVALSLSWIDRGDKVGQLNYHYITDKNVVWPDEPNETVEMNLAPIGIASYMLSLASAGMEEMHKITFSDNTEVVSGVKALQGYKFKNGNKETLIILNLTDKDINKIKIDNLFSYAGDKKLKQYWSDTPYEVEAYEGHKIQFHQKNINLSNFDSHNFSISVIEIESSMGLNDNISKKIKVSPNPFNNTIVISNCAIKDVRFFNFQGQELTSKLTFEKKGKDTVVNTSNLPKGYYVVKVADITTAIIK